MIIEWLKVEVPLALREQYLQKDAEIWTSLLSKYPGFLGKEIWINPHAETEVVMVIQWHDRESWKSIPAEVLQAADRQFTEAMGKSFPFIEQEEYQVRESNTMRQGE